MIGQHGVRLNYKWVTDLHVAKCAAQQFEVISQKAQTAGGEAGAPAPAPRASIERELAEYGAALSYETLPRAVVEAAKRLLIDALACGYGAIGSPTARIVEATFRKSFGGPQVASVL